MDYSIISLCLYFVLLISIGVYALKNSTADNGEYLLGGRNVSAKVTALSAGASDMSGWMLMGLPGAAFVTGLNSIWLALGLVVGAYVNYRIVAPKLRVFSEIADDSLTIPEFLSKRFAKNNGAIRSVSALVIIVFFTLYTASGLVAGGKLFETAFGLSFATGVFATVSIVVIYTVLGGFLAVSLSDFVQGVIMLIALLIVPVVTFNELDPIQVESLLSSVSLLQNELSTIAIISLMTWGLGYFGQPHIIVRFMAIDSHKNVPNARKIGMSWMTLSIVGAVMTGLIGAKYAQTNKELISDPETVFVFLSQYLFHPAIAGGLLAAILAAIMSTISSQLLVTSSSLVEDVYKVYRQKAVSEKSALLLSRIGVVGVAIVASLIAFGSNASVLSLVSNAWAGFGAAFGPAILFSLWWRQTTHTGALSGIIVGAVSVIAWAHLPLLANQAPLSSLFYELLPAFALSSATIFLVSLYGQRPKENAVKWFNQTQQLTQ